MTDPELDPPEPSATPLSDATGDGQTGDDLTDLDFTVSTDPVDGEGPAEADDYPDRPAPCTAEGGDAL